ncbi:(d)CMP kinase [Candidatus Poribacteria bacterium]|nr:(d)CMP kinase [Candidatus Poribacteria bacterium]
MLVIAIDGPAGAGKSTIAQIIADKLDLLYINTGAMYRAVTWQAIQEKIDLKDQGALAELTRRCNIIFRDNGKKIILNGVDVSREIRYPEVDKHISDIVKLPKVREIMVERQKQLGRIGNVITEGRDVTTIVFPDADVKIYLDASLEERAKRRYLQFESKGHPLNQDQVKRETARRDKADSSREHGPLRVAPDAITIDTTDKDIQQVVDEIIAIIKREVNAC